MNCLWRDTLWSCRRRRNRDLSDSECQAIQFKTQKTNLTNRTMHLSHIPQHTMVLLSDTWNCRLRMRREYQECFPCHWLQRKPPVSNPGMYHDTCVMQVPWCMSGLLTWVAGKTVPAVPAHAQSAILCICREAYAKQNGTFLFWMVYCGV